MPNQPADNKERLNTMAASTITGLREFMHQELALIHTRLGVVTATAAGPPPTITVTIYGETVPGIRYIGTTPSIGATVVLIADGPFYICLGALAA